jgi:hypothetical protein
MARLVMLWAGVPLMVLGALLGVGGLVGSDSLWQHAVPFWMFVGGLGLALGGASMHERQVTIGRPVSPAGAYAANYTAGPAPVSETFGGTAASGLSSLKRPAPRPALDTAEAVHARITAIEAENKSLRDYLLAAKVSIAR